MRTSKFRKLAWQCFGVWVLCLALIPVYGPGIGRRTAEAAPSHPTLLFGSSDISDLRTLAQNTTVHPDFGVAPSTIWNNLKARADSYLSRTFYTDAGSRTTDIKSRYYLYAPYWLEPVPHGLGPSLALGTATSTAGYAKKIRDSAIDDNDYYIELDYQALGTDTNSFEQFVVWSSNSGDGTTDATIADGAFEDVVIYHTGNSLYATDGNLSTLKTIGTVTKGTWYKLLLHVKSNDTVDISMDGVFKTSAAQIGSGHMKNVGPLGDTVADSVHAGSGYIDNIKVYMSDRNMPAFTEYFDDYRFVQTGWASSGGGTVNLTYTGHGISNSLALGSSSSLFGWARKTVPELTTDDYYINFDYMAPESDTAAFNNFFVWGSYDGSEYDDVVIRHTGNTLTATDGPGSSVTLGTITKDRWYNILIHVKSDDTADISIDAGTPVTVAQVGTGNLKAIGYVGDVSTLGHDGSGYIDNIRIYDSHTPIYAEYFDHGNLDGWTTNGYAELPDPAVLSHADFGWTGTGYPYWSAIASFMSDAVITLSLAYIIEDNSNYADKAKEYMLSLANWSTWNDPGYNCHPCLDTQYSMLGLSLGYDMLYDDLALAERTAIAGAIKHKGLDPSYETTQGTTGSAAYNGLRMAYNNVVAANASMGFAAIAISGDVTVAPGEASPEDIRDQARTNLESMFRNGVDIEGGWGEGIGYAEYSLSNVLPYYDAEKRANNYTLNDGGFLQKFADFMLYTQYPDGSNFSQIGDTYRGQWMDTVLPYYAEHSLGLNAAFLMERLNTLQHAGSIYEFLWFPANAPAAATPDNVLGKVFPTIRWSGFKTGWGADDSMLLMRSGGPDSHMQRDLNSIELVKAGSPLAFDPGYQSIPGEPRYDYTFGSLGHNLIVVDDTVQCANSFIQCRGVVDRFFVNEDYGYTVGDAAMAYNGMMPVARRTVVSVPAGKYFLVYDDYENDTNSRSVKWNLHTTSEDVSVNSSNVTAQVGNEFLNMQILKPASPAISVTDDLFSAPQSYSFNDRSTVVASLPDNTSTYQLTVEYSTFAPTEVVQYRNSSGSAGLPTVLEDALDYETVFPNPSGAWKTATLTLDPALYDFYPNKSNYNVVVQFNDIMYVKSMTLTKVGAPSVFWTVNAGDSGDNDIDQQNPGISFGSNWKRPISLQGSPVRGNFRTKQIQVDLPASVSGNQAMTLMYPTSGSAGMYSTEEVSDTDTNGVIVSRSGTRDLILFHDHMLDPDVLPSAFYNDAGTNGDNNVSQHNPGIAVGTGWNSASTVDGRTVRSAAASSSPTVIASVSDVNKKYKVAIRYKASESTANGELKQLLDTGGSYETLGKLKGDGTWRIDTFTLDRRYYDSDGAASNVNIQLQISNSDINVSDMWVAAVGEAGYTDVGTAGDSTMAGYAPSVHLDSGWGNITAVDGLSARISGEPSQLYVNIQHTDHAFDLVLRYKTSTAARVWQRGTAQFEVIGNLVADGQWHIGKFRIYKPYYDAGSALSNTNVLLKIDGGVTLADAWAETAPFQTVNYTDAGIESDMGVSFTDRHNPGVSLNYPTNPAVWSATAANVDGYSVRQSSGASTVHVNLTNTRNTHRVYFRYKSSANITVQQWGGASPGPGYQDVGTLVGDNTWRVGSVELKLNHFDYYPYPAYPGTNVLLSFSQAITLADVWLETEEADRRLDSNDVGTMYDDKIIHHEPGISIYPSSLRWDPPSVVDGVSVRVSASGADPNLYVNLLDTNRKYNVTLTYKAASNGQLQQYTPSGYTSLGTLTGDGTWRTVTLPMSTSYRDYTEAHTDSPDSVNVLLKITTPITISDMSVEYAE